MKLHESTLFISAGLIFLLFLCGCKMTTASIGDTTINPIAGEKAEIIPTPTGGTFLAPPGRYHESGKNWEYWDRWNDTANVAMFATKDVSKTYNDFLKIYTGGYNYKLISKKEKQSQLNYDKNSAHVTFFEYKINSNIRKITSISTKGKGHKDLLAIFYASGTEKGQEDMVNMFLNTYSATPKNYD